MGPPTSLVMSSGKMPFLQESKFFHEAAGRRNAHFSQARVCRTAGCDQSPMLLAILDHGHPSSLQTQIAACRRDNQLLQAATSAEKQTPQPRLLLSTSTTVRAQDWQYMRKELSSIRSGVTCLEVRPRVERIPTTPQCPEGPRMLFPVSLPRPTSPRFALMPAHRA